MKSSEIRRAFIDFFIKNNHQLVHSSSLVPGQDPTLLFTNAGMVQFKDTFLGLEKKPYQRAVSAQRCLRAGGKHNDLENVGYTARHHTFFEMLGNFSFGNYFKKDAIRYAWTFLTTILNLPIERLWITVYKDDQEAYDIWINDIGVSPERLSRCGDADNFWSMGDTGPCGPCTEIFYDHGEAIPGGPPGSEEQEGDRYVEIWNLVFMQFNRDKEGNLHPLPTPSVDTGMGLERIAAVVQGVHSNYDIDIFQCIIKAIQALSPESNPQDPSFKVIADHLRATSFLIADGVQPSNEGRGYVLRRIIRRAVKHGNQVGIVSPFFHKLVPSLIETMGDAYPELIAQQKDIQATLLQEENQFAATLTHGLNLLKNYLPELKATGTAISGELAFKLYDTYGFPVDLTADIAREQGLSVDMPAFQSYMDEQKKRSQSAQAFSADYSALSQIQDNTPFHGYDKESIQTHIINMFEKDKPIDCLTAGMKGFIVLKDTVFYAESGGQVGDTGQLQGPHGLFEVSDTKRVGEVILHHGKISKGTIHLNDSIEARVDSQRRQAIRLNHTATHLLHAALKQLVDPTIQQKGSLVDADRARFDFSYKKALTSIEIEQLERLINTEIRQNTLVETNIMSLQAATQSGAIALFDEKYADDVRVLSIGDFSKELCGGTHVNRTGDIGFFKITAEYGVANGIRRIEWVTGEAALTYVQQAAHTLEAVSTTLKTNPDKISEKLSQFLHQIKQQEKDLVKLQAQQAAFSVDSLLKQVEKHGNINVLIAELKDGKGSQALRTTLDHLKSRLDHAVMVLFSKQEGKIQVIASVSKSLLGQVPKANLLVQTLCGKGGGREDMAQGGSEVPSDLDKKLKILKELILSFNQNLLG